MLVEFMSKLELTNAPDDDGDWLLVQDFALTLDGKEVVVPKGFRTDLASTPRYLWSVFPPFGRWDEAATVHDWFYRTVDLENRPTRKEADDAFYAIMIFCNVPKWRALDMWSAVRLFGGSSYRV